MSLRLSSAGESHGPALVAIVSGLPAGLILDRDAIDADLKRRQEGYGRSPRQQIEQDRVEVLAGLRRGLISGEVDSLPTPEGSRLVFRPETAVYHVQTQAVMILLLATAGGLLTLVWPFVPKLLSVAPFGALIALGGWFLVVSRLRTSGPDEFLAAVAAHEERD